MAGLVLAAPAAWAASPQRLEAQAPANQGRWGERVADAGDLNGDGVNDLIVADPQETVGGVSQAGKIYAMSGATAVAGGTPAPLWSISSPAAAGPETREHFGFVVTVVNDLNGDGKRDVAVGSDHYDAAGNNTDIGEAWVVSGANGALLFTLTNPVTQSGARFGSRLGDAGDIYNSAAAAFVGTGSPPVVGDGKDEIIAGASALDSPAGCSPAPTTSLTCRKGEGGAFILDGATGAVVRTLAMPAADRVPTPCTTACGSFGLSVQGPGDVDGDGVPDQQIAAPSFGGDAGVIYVFSGKTGGDPIRRIIDPTPNALGFFGFQDVTPRSPGDVNGDGTPDIYGEGWLQDGPAGPAQGQAFVFSGAGSVLGSALLYTVNDPHPHSGGQFGWSATSRTISGPSTDVAATFNKKNTLYVGASPHFLQPTGDEDGGTYLFASDASKAVALRAVMLKDLNLPQIDQQAGSSSNPGPNLGWTLAAPGDLNGDGRPDFVAGAPFWDNGVVNLNQGRVYVYDSPGYSEPYCEPLPNGAPAPTCVTPAPVP